MNLNILDRFLIYVEQNKNKAIVKLGRHGVVTCASNSWRTLKSPSSAPPIPAERGIITESAIPRLGILIFTAPANRTGRTNPGTRNMILKPSTRASALGFSSLRQSSNSNSGCRTGSCWSRPTSFFEYSIYKIQTHVTYVAWKEQSNGFRKTGTQGLLLNSN